MTTNMSECFNGVLVGARRLPITAIVRITFQRTKNFFVERIFTNPDGKLASYTHIVLEN
ncbi:hypothetical protein ACS0TY_002996 [Phlomoides rotata]